MAPQPLCLAICSRCRNSERIAAGALDAPRALAAAREALAAHPEPVFCRLTQCLHCCDGGHTVRVERGGTEVALVGIRTADELVRVALHIDALGRGEVPASLARRLWQRWRDHKMVWHRNLAVAGADAAPVEPTGGRSSSAGSPAHGRPEAPDESSA